MTLAELAITVALLGVLGVVAGRFGLSAIPAYLLAGLLLGPNQPTFLSVIEPSEVTSFLAELGVVFLLFFLGLEFSFGRLVRSGRYVALGGVVDLLVNGLLGLVVGVAAFGLSPAAIVTAAAVYVSSSAMTIKGLTDFRRLADDETDLVLGVLLFEDLVLALVLGFASGAGGGRAETAAIVAKALLFITASLTAARLLHGPIDRLLARLPREFFLLGAFSFLVGMAALAHELGLSSAIGALMAGVVLSETGARDEIEERFFGFRDLFAALFFFVFGLSIDVSAIGDVGWLLALAVVVTLVGKIGGGYVAGVTGGFSRRQSLNAGIALVPHGEFTIILAQLATTNDAISDADAAELAAFAGLYVLVTATVGVVLMKESKRLGRRIFRPPTLAQEA